LGFGRNVSRCNLAGANELRDCQIYEDFAYEMVALTRRGIVGDVDFSLGIPGNVYAFDFRTIYLCLNAFWWAKFRTAKGAMNTLFAAIHLPA
jgi:hypothetical protein